VFVLDGAVIVYLFERHAPGSNIHTLGNAVGWAAGPDRTAADRYSSRKFSGRYR